MFELAGQHFLSPACGRVRDHFLQVYQMCSSVARLHALGGLTGVGAMAPITSPSAAASAYALGSPPTIGQEFPSRAAAHQAIRAFTKTHGKRAVNRPAIGDRNSLHYVCESAAPCTFVVDLKPVPASTRWRVCGMNLRHQQGCTSLHVTAAAKKKDMEPASVRRLLDLERLMRVLLSKTREGKQPSAAAQPAPVYVQPSSVNLVRSVERSLTSGQRVRDLLARFQTVNPSARSDVQLDAHQKLDRACIIRPFASTYFMASQRILGIHATEISHDQFNGCCLRLIGRNGNGQTLTLAVAVCQKAAPDMYAWFLDNVKRSGISITFVPIIVDGSHHDALRLAMAAHPDFVWRYCTAKLAMKLQQEVHLTEIEDVYDMQSAPTEDEFNLRLQQLARTHQSAYMILNNLDPEIWAMYPNMQRYGMYGCRTTVLRDTSELPASVEVSPFRLFEQEISLFAQTTSSLHHEAKAWRLYNFTLTPYAMKALDRERNVSKYLQVMPHNGSLNYVENNRDDEIQLVDSAKRTCTCGMIDQHCAPCRHLLAVVASIGGVRDSDLVTDACYFVDRIFEAFTSPSVVLPSTMTENQTQQSGTQVESRSQPQTPLSSPHANGHNHSQDHGRAPSIVPNQQHASTSPAQIQRSTTPLTPQRAQTPPTPQRAQTPPAPRQENPVRPRQQQRQTEPQQSTPSPSASESSSASKKRLRDDPFESELLKLMDERINKPEAPGRKKKTCSLCKCRGHNRRTCPSKKK